MLFMLDLWAGNGKVASSNPGFFFWSAEVSLSRAPHPDQLPVALRGEAWVCECE